MYLNRTWRYTAAKIWNALPDQFRTTDKIGTFKNLMSRLAFLKFYILIAQIHVY